MTKDEMTRFVRHEQELIKLVKAVNDMALNLAALTPAVTNAVQALTNAAATQAALTQCQADETAAQTQVDALTAQLTGLETPAT